MPVSAGFKRSVYLRLIPPAEAVELAKAVLDREALVGEETVPSHEASGRVLSQGVHARLSSPSFHSAAMDGYAVHAADTFAAREDNPCLLRENRDCFAVNTGHPLPAKCDAVIMIEHVSREEGGPHANGIGQNDIRVEAPVFPWQHVRRIGEDIVATELLFPRNHCLAPWDVGALLTAGVWEVPVRERVRVRIIPTGDEVLDFAQRPEPGLGQVVESNSQMLAALIREAGGVPECVPPVPDEAQALHRALRQALESGAPVVMFCAGSSAGSRDFTRSTLEREGEVLAHGIAVMPGKPTLVARCGKALVIGAPGYPVSTLVCFEEVLAPLLAWLGRRAPAPPVTVEVELGKAVPSRLGIEEVVRLHVGRVDEKLVALPLGRGAGNIATVTRAQALVRVPAAVEGFAEGTRVRAELRVPVAQTDRILMAVGSHDNTLDVLADELMTGGMDGSPSVQLVSAHVGSMGGITALRNGTCHLSGMHLFDPDTDDFNFSFLARFLPDLEVTVVNLAIRQQGLIVAPGNPLRIRGIADLPRLRFINRQRGAGTRVLLDWELKKAGLAAQTIDGYEKEEFTHMGVAANVLAGTADCGMGIYAAAKALGLDFVPLARERYDLVIPTRFGDDPRVAALLKLVRTASFQSRVREQGGYETELSGQIMRPGQGLRQSVDGWD